MKPDDRFFLIDYETTGVSYSDVPIEVGVIVTDPSWRVIEEYASLIQSPEALRKPINHWGAAQDIHGIKKSMLVDAPHARDVAERIDFLANHQRTGRMILLSDNIQFEWRHTDWLLQHIGLTCPDVFHYCGWDTSILSVFTDFEDPANTEHRALSDVRGLLGELKRVAGHADSRKGQLTIEDTDNGTK